MKRLIASSLLVFALSFTVLAGNIEVPPAAPPPPPPSSNTLKAALAPLILRALPYLLPLRTLSL